MVKAIVLAAAIIQVVSISLAVATCPPTAATIDSPDLAGCFTEWDQSNPVQPPVGLTPAQLATVKSLAWFDALLAAADDHKSKKPTTKIDVGSFRTAKATLDKKLRDEAFDKFACAGERTWCLDRDGSPFDPREVTPELVPGDRLLVLVLSYQQGDKDRISVASRSIASVPTLFPAPIGVAAGGAVSPTPYFEVTRLDLVVPTEIARLEISVLRAADANGNDANTKRHTLSIQRRRHVVELGLALPFALDRRVSGSGAVSYGIEPELAFAIALFPGTRITDEALQPKGASWFGIVLAADVTRALSEKRYYAGLDFAPISGLSFDAGFAIMPWAYVPSPSNVDDTLMGDIDPEHHYHVSFFFGIRATADFFRTTKAAYDGLQTDLGH